MDSAVRTQGHGRSEAGFDAGLRAHMVHVYNLMMAGVALTGVVAWFVSTLSVDDGVLTEFGRILFEGPLSWVVMLAPIAIVLVMAFRAHLMSAGALAAAFVLYATALGILIGPMLVVYTGASVAKVFFISAASFGAMSLWGYVTKRDLTGLGTFLLMGLFGLIIASIVNLFLASGPLDFVISFLAVGVFAGFAAYDTQKIKECYLGAHGGDSTAKLAILGAFTLYTDFVGLFVHLTNLLGERD